MNGADFHFLSLTQNNTFKINRASESTHNIRNNLHVHRDKMVLN